MNDRHAKFHEIPCVVCQAINSLAVADDNKPKLVEAGILPLYVKLLSSEQDEMLRAKAARGLWLLAFKCKDDIINQPTCLQGLSVCL